MEGVMLQWGKTSQRMPFGKKVRQEIRGQNNINVYKK